MATAAQIAEVRANVREPNDVEPYTDDYLTALIDAYGINGASAKIWRSKAASVAHLTDISEGGSSRKTGNTYKQFLEIAKTYEDADGGGLTPTTQRPISRPAVRV